MLRRLTLLAVPLGLCALAAWVGFGAFAGETVHTAVGARARGGGAVTAALRNDPASVFGNPALIADSEQTVFMLDAAQGAIVGAAPIHPNGAISFGVLNLDPVESIGPLAIGANRSAMGYGRAFGRVRAGLTLDRWAFAEGERRAGFSIGALAELAPYLHFGAHGIWMAQSGWEMLDQLRDDDRTRPGGWDLRLGAQITPIDALRLRTELSGGEPALGAEAEWREFAARAGMRGSSRISLGVSARMPQGAVAHYAYEYERSKSSSGEHSLSLSFPLRAPAPPPPPAPIIVVPQGADPPMRIVARAIDTNQDIPLDARHSLRRLIEHHSQKYGIEAALIFGVVHAESDFRPDAVSKSHAVGLFQLMPPAARDMGMRLPESAILDRAKDPRFNPIQNADAGIRYLAHLMHRFEWNYALAVAAYNAGPGRIASDIPQRPETERYVSRVMNFYYRYRNNPAAMDEAWRRLERLSPAAP